MLLIYDAEFTPYLAPPVTLSLAMCIINSDYHEIIPTDGNPVQDIITFHLTLRRGGFNVIMMGSAVISWLK